MKIGSDGKTVIYVREAVSETVFSGQSDTQLLLVTGRYL